MASNFRMKQRGRPALRFTEMQARIHKAINEGRTQQALELARSLFKQDPSPDHLELLKKATLERARQLRNNGYTRDASTVLANAMDLGGSDFLKQVAEEMARCGEAQSALAILQQSNDPSLRARVESQAADAAMRQGAAGRNQLPEALRPAFDLIRQAFAHFEVGQDDAARTSLQGIGLHSPFLEWKLLLRGFLAYYQNDNVRALENWQRLDVERLPARLAAPFRFLIDPAFRQAQAPAIQNQLQKAADQLQGSSLIVSLRNLQRSLANEDELPQAFRQAEAMLPMLREQAPALVPRLAACFYWAIVNHGNPEDMQRYRRVFGLRTDDPGFDRLGALAMEHRHEPEQAHLYWQDFEKWLADEPAWGSAELRQRARALIWKRMGDNAAGVADMAEELPPFLRRMSPKHPDLKPTAEQCFRKSLALARDCLATHEALFGHYRNKEQTAKAITAGKALLKQFPDHVPTLETLGDLLQEREEYDEALRFYQRAMQINPLERRLRGKVGTTHICHARSLAEAKQFDEARAEYQAALQIADRDKAMVLAKWAACEFKAGNSPRADELILQAREHAGHPLAVAHYLTIEAIRFKLPVPLKTRFADDFNRCLAEPAVVDAARKALNIQAAHRFAKVKYHGQGSHEKKVLAYLEKALLLPWTEEHLEEVCQVLLQLRAQKLLNKVIKRGRTDFPANPVFVLKEVEAKLSRGPRYCRPWQIAELLERAQRLTDALPHNDRKQKILQEIHDLQDLGQGPSAPPGFPPLQDLMEMMEEMLGPDDDDDEYDDGFF